MRCDVERNTAAADDWGAPGAPGWASHLTDKACYAWIHTGREVLSGLVVVVTELHIMFPLHTDVTEKDRIVSVTDRQGNELYPGPMNIKNVERRAYFITVTVESTT